MISRRGSGGGEETHPADGQRRLLHSGLAVDLRAPAARGRAQRPLPAGLHLAPPLLRRNRMLHRRLENLLRLSHRVRLAAIFRKSIHLFFRDQNHFLKRGGGGDFVGRHRDLCDDTDSALFCSAHEASLVSLTCLPVCSVWDPNSSSCFFFVLFSVPRLPEPDCPN